MASDRRAYVRHEWVSALIVVASAAAILPGLTAAGGTLFVAAYRLRSQSIGFSIWYTMPSASTTS